MKPILGHNGTTKDTAPKPLVVNVEEGVPKLLLFGILGQVERFGHKWFLMSKQGLDYLRSPDGWSWEVLFVLRAGKARPELRLMAMFMAW